MGFGAWGRHKRPWQQTSPNDSGWQKHDRPAAQLRLRVTRVMPLSSLGQKTFTSPLTTSGERRTAALCSHTGAEAVLAFARAFRGLKGAFHGGAVAVWEGLR